MYELLTSLGLSDKEATLYLAVLELGKASVQQLADQAKLKRVTAYVVLEELMKIGLVKQASEGKKNYYHATHPSTLEQLLNGRISRLESQRSNLRSHMDQLEALYNFRSDKPVVRFFEGKEGLEELDMYERDRIQDGTEILAMSPHDLVRQAFPKRRVNSVNERVAQKITARTIYVDDRAYTEKENEKQLRKAIHFSRKELPITGTCIVYPNWGVKFLNYEDIKFEC